MIGRGAMIAGTEIETVSVIVIVTTEAGMTEMTVAAMGLERGIGIVTETEIDIEMETGGVMTAMASAGEMIATTTGGANVTRGRMIVSEKENDHAHSA